MLVFGLVGSANADTYYEEFTSDVWLNRNNTSATWTFDLDNDLLFEAWIPFVGPVGSADINTEDTITSALFSIGFYDDERDYWGGKKEYGGLIVDGTSWFSNEEIGTSDSIFAANVLGELVDHVLTVRVDRISGDFGVDFTSLGGTFIDNPTPPEVPEPGTMLLMGAGLLGILGYNRKRFNKKS